MEPCFGTNPTVAVVAPPSGCRTSASCTTLSQQCFRARCTVSLNPKPLNLSGPHHINPTFVVQLRLEGKGLWSAFHCIEECSSRAQGLSVRDPGSAEGLEFRFQGCILRDAWVVGLGSAFRKTEPKSKEPKSNRHAYIKRTDCHVHNHHPNQCQHHQLNISSKKAASD